MSQSKRNDVLKLIALMTMLFDHIGYLFFPGISFFRTVGRIAFPIFAYQVALGFHFTSNRWLYAKRIFIFGLISIVPYAFFNPQLEFKPWSMNIMFLLLMGLGAMWLWEKSLVLWRSKKNGHGILAVFVFLLWALYMMSPRILELTFEPLKLSYAGYGLWMMMLFYWFKDRPYWLLAGYLMISLAAPMADGIVAYARVNMGPDALNYFSAMAYAINYMQQKAPQILSLQGGILKLDGFFFQSRSLLGLIVIFALENKAFAFKMHRDIAYWFYPLHMAILLLALKWQLLF